MPDQALLEKMGNLVDKYNGALDIRRTTRKVYSLLGYATCSDCHRLTSTAQALEEVETALVSFGHNQISTTSIANEVKANRKTYYLAKQLYLKGIDNFITVLDAERSLRLSEDQLIDIKRDTAFSLISLYKSLGGGWEEII